MYRRADDGGDRGSGDCTRDDECTPRRVKAAGIVALLLAFVVLRLAGGGFGHRVAEHMR